jgi:serine/threonine protein kinase
MPNLEPEKPAVAPSSPGERLRSEAGRTYVLGSRVGWGRFSVVYAAECEETQTTVLLKRGRNASPKRTARHFAAEKEALQHVNHPNIVPLLDSGVTPAGEPFHIVPHDGGSPLLRYCTANRSPLTQRLQFFSDICRAVSHLHEQGIAHCDINPTNVMVCSQEGSPAAKLIDFGNSQMPRKRNLQGVVGRFRRWFFGSLPPRFHPGQLSYTSPDHLGGAPDSTDPQTDVYCLGLLLHHLLTGRVPFEPEYINEAAFRDRIRHALPTAPSAVLRCLKRPALESEANLRQCAPSGLAATVAGFDDIVLRCLEKRKIERYQSVAELSADLSRSAARRPRALRPFHRLRSFWIRLRLHKRETLVVAGVAFFSGLAVGIAIISR